MGIPSVKHNKTFGSIFGDARFSWLQRFDGHDMMVGSDGYTWIEKQA